MVAAAVETLAVNTNETAEVSIARRTRITNSTNKRVAFKTVCDWGVLSGAGNAVQRISHLRCILNKDICRKGLMGTLMNSGVGS